MWLGRFVTAEVLNANAAFRVVAAVDPGADRRVFVVAAEPRGDVARARAALDRLYAGHHQPRHRVIAPAVERAEHEATPYVVFDFPARFDFDQLLQFGLDGGWRAPYGPADGFSTTIRDALLANAEPPAYHLGTFANGNVLFAADGRHVVVGFGHNVVVHDAEGRPVVRGRFFQAPEVAVGGKPTLSSDLVAMIEMTRAGMSFVDVNEAITRVLRGNTLREDVELGRLMLWFETRVMRGKPARRPPVADIIATSNRIRELIGSRPDPAAFREFVAQVVMTERPDFLGASRSLEVARDGAWFMQDGVRSDLARNPLLGRLLMTLVQARLATPGRSLSVEELIAAGWPGEKMQRESAANRLYVAIAALRRAGLGPDLERDGGGYRLKPSVRVELVDGAPATA